MSGPAMDEPRENVSRAAGGAPLVTARCLEREGFVPAPGARLTPLAQEELWRRRSRSSAPDRRRPEPASGGGSGPAELGAYIDHTLLAPEATAGEIDELCAQALEHRFATVCVNGTWVCRCAEILAGSGVLVCAVVGFPLGASVSEVKVHEARRAIEDGAREIDMVMNVGALRSGDDELVYRDIAAVAEACHRLGARLKVILETCLLTDAEKVRACRAAERAGADFVKTSTGFSEGGATVEDVALIRRAVGPAMGVKASGGVRDARIARALLAAGATRLGTSASVALVRGRGGEEQATAGAGAGASRA